MPDNNALIGQIANSWTQGATALASNAINWKYNRKAMKLQNKFNVDMWKMQADYNSPQAQMKRFQEAGLNPNLIYGQGSNGNMSSAPEQGVATPPDFTPGMKKIAEAFNIENLRTTIANRKKAEAEAQISSIDAANEKDQRSAMRDFGNLYSFDPKKGSFVWNDGVRVERIMSNHERALERYTGAPSVRVFYFNNLHSGAYQRTALLNPRAQLLNAQYRYLQPQILMSQFEQQHQPTTYWIGQGTKIIGSLPLPKLNWSFGGPRTLINNHRSDNRSYDYKQNITNY